MKMSHVGLGLLGVGLLLGAAKVGGAVWSFGAEILTLQKEVQTAVEQTPGIAAAEPALSIRGDHETLVIYWKPAADQGNESLEVLADHLFGALQQNVTRPSDSVLLAVVDHDEVEIGGLSVSQTKRHFAKVYGDPLTDDQIDDRLDFD